MGLKEKFAYKKLHKLSSKVKRVVELPEINSIKKVGVIWLPHQNEALEYLRNHFSNPHTIFKRLCINTIKKTGKISINEVSHADINWWGLPKREKFEEFITTEFDLLLDLSMERSLVIDYFNALTTARFKIGYAESKENYFDLNINIGENKDALFLAQQQIFYLAQLNQKEDK